MSVPPHQHDDGALGRQMRIGVLVPARAVDHLPPQAVRLLAELLADPTFAVRVFEAEPAPPEPVSTALAFLLTAERRFQKPPQRLALPKLPALRIEAAAAARTAALDAIVDLGGGPVDPALARTAAQGLWRIAATPLRDALTGATYTKATLVRYNGSGKGRVIARAGYDTKPLATHNVAYVREKSAQIILRELKRCAQMGTSADLGSAETAVAATRPGAFEYMTLTAGKFLLRIRRQFARRRHRIFQGFSLRLGRGTALEFDPSASHPVPMPENALWADPFLITHEGESYCFFEDFDPIADRGHISVGRVTETGLADVQVALKQPHHMSYPFVFHHDGALFMMPEVHGAGQLEIWHCTAFPSGWQRYATAFEGTSLVDSVLLERDGTWWLFTHISRDSFDDYCSDLHVFRLDGPDLTGLVPHRLNPVVTDASTARGGGRVHKIDGKLIRFSQDNSGGSYGHGLNVMEVVRLDLDHYEERVLRHINPDFLPGLVGCHHFDALDGRFVIDVRKA